MAGRVYLCAITALVLASAHVEAFFLRPFVAPLIHPQLVGGLPFLGAPLLGGSYKQPVAKTKPLSRPFTMLDAQAAGQFPLGAGGFVLDSRDGFNDFGNDINGLGGSDFGLAAATNDVNVVGLAGAVDPLDAISSLDITDSPVLVTSNAGLGYNAAPLGTRVNGDVSDSTVFVQGSGLGYNAAPLGTRLNGDVSDSTVFVQGSGVGGLPVGTVATAF